MRPDGSPAAPPGYVGLLGIAADGDVVFLENGESDVCLPTGREHGDVAADTEPEVFPK